ncbi:Crp/Fnr family transcriptional regulator [Mucilaginibacter lacusdianchii]|uniref:Crp/Fnr family transcriptional regulator n=1 Tax=Mucilaginibacter lacusdianchii TaxID=2684211 RepID=UPI00131E9E28|nr:Crp/Fnr family transcriptional regulator [Mucilaginibacter sp. JXJ CY 39]
MDQVNALQIFRERLTRFITFTDEEWRLFNENADFKTLHKKEFFIKEGEVCKEMAFIISGAVRFFHIKDGNDITNYFCFSNEYLSAYKSFLTGEPTVTNIQALEETELISITQKEWQRLLAHPKLALKVERFGRLMAEHYLCCYEDRVTAFVTQSPEERYLDLLQTGKDVLQRIPQHYIAHYLGVTPVSLSRIRRRTLEIAR